MLIVFGFDARIERALCPPLDLFELLPDAPPTRIPAEPRRPKMGAGAADEEEETPPSVDWSFEGTLMLRPLLASWKGWLGCEVAPFIMPAAAKVAAVGL
jgi:hypothetical protein